MNKILLTGLWVGSLLVPLSLEASEVKMAFDKCPPHESGSLFTGGCGLILCESDSAAQTIKEDGGGRVSLPHSGDGADRDPAYSQDGRFLTLAQGGKLIVAKYDGTERTEMFDLTENGRPRLRIAHPTWSPDGRRIAFVAFEVGRIGERFSVGGAGSIWVASSVDNAAITPPSRLTFSEVAEGHFHLPGTARPAWNSTGTAFAFTMAVSDPDPAIDSRFDQLYTASLSGTDWSLRRLTSNQFSLGAHWGPRYGDMVAYSALTPTSHTPPQRRLITPGQCQPTGNGTEPGITPGQGGIGGATGIGTFCAPAGVTTVYEHDATPVDFDIYKIDPAAHAGAFPTPTPINLTARWRTRHNACWYTDGNPNPHRGPMRCQTLSQGSLEGSSFSPSWDISGNHIAFQSQKFGGYWTYIIDEDGEDLDRFGPPANPEIVPGGGAVWFFRPNWSPNGDKIAVLGCVQDCTVTGGHGVVPKRQIFVSPTPNRGRTITALTNDSDGQVGNPSWGRVPIEFTPPPPDRPGDESRPNTGGPIVDNCKYYNACERLTVRFNIQAIDPDGDRLEVTGPYLRVNPTNPLGDNTPYQPTLNPDTGEARDGTEITEGRDGFRFYWRYWWLADLPRDPATGQRLPIYFTFVARERDRSLDAFPPATSRAAIEIRFPTAAECGASHMDDGCRD